MGLQDNGLRLVGDKTAPNHRYAYVTFLMRNDSFLPGALVLAYALRTMGTSADIVCLVTREISCPAKSALSLLFDKVIAIEEVTVPHPMRQKRQDRPFLFTRFAGLLLGKNGGLGEEYDKIIMMDADVLPLRCYDRLFAVEAPAGILNEKKEHWVDASDGRYRVPDDADIKGWGWHRRYEGVCPHGTVIPQAITDSVKTDVSNMGVNAALWVLRPDKQVFDELIAAARQDEMLPKYPWPEMQFATGFFSGRWHNIDIRYGSIGGYPFLSALFGTHFAGLKPWSMEKPSVCTYAKYEDFQCWYATFLAMVSVWLELLQIPRLQKLRRFILENVFGGEMR